MKHLTLGLESISFQSGIFYKELTNIIEKARTAGKTNENKLKTATAISDCVFKHSKIRCTVEFIDDFDNACIYPTFLAPENVLHSHSRREMFKNYYDELSAIRPGGTIEGFVNASNGTVGGEFSKVTHASYYDTDFIFRNNKFTAEGAAAVVLHEIGHAYTFFQYVADTVLFNVTLQHAYQDLVNARDKNDIKMIVSRSRKAMKLKNKSDWSEEMYDSDKETIINVLAAEATVERGDRDNRAFYTQDASEELAEIYCVRQGGAAGLIEVRRYFGERGIISNLNFSILSGALLAFIGAGVMMLLPAVSAAVAPIFIAGVVSVAKGSAAAATAPDFTKLSQTVGKIRNEMVTRLKETNLPKTVISDCLDIIDQVEKTIKEVPDERTPMAVAFFDLFRKSKRGAREWREYSDKIEALSTNDLFVRSARMSLKY